MLNGVKQRKQASKPPGEGINALALFASAVSAQEPSTMKKQNSFSKSQALISAIKHEISQSLGKEKQQTEQP